MASFPSLWHPIQDCVAFPVHTRVGFLDNIGESQALPLPTGLGWRRQAIILKGVSHEKHETIE